MSLILTPLFSDGFNRANEYPLSGNWTVDTYGDDGLRVTSDLCEGSFVGFNGYELCTQTAPSDQYASCTLAASIASGAYAALGVRYVDTGVTFPSLPGYQLIIENAAWLIYSFPLGGTLASGSLTTSANDVFTLTAIGTTLSAIQNGNLLGSVTNTSYTSGLTALRISLASSLSAVQISNFTMGSAAITYSISGNAGIASALITYNGTSSGNVTADGSGNFTISGLTNGSYTITPSLSGYTFSPTSANETVSGSNITGVNFTATKVSHYSVPDCRIKPNASRNVNGTLIYDVQTSSNDEIPPTDSREAGAPIPSGEYPQNSRAPGTFGPGE